jgi:hypothetical protein
MSFTNDTKYWKTFTPKAQITSMEISPELNNTYQPAKGQTKILMNWSGTVSGTEAILAPGITASDYIKASLNPSVPNFPSYNLPRGRSFMTTTSTVNGGMKPKPSTNQKK